MSSTSSGDKVRNERLRDTSNVPISDESRARYSRAERWRIWANALTWMVVGGCMAVVLVILSVIVYRQNHSVRLLHEVDNTNRILINCTVPGHKCYEDGRKRTADVVRQLEVISVAANYCTAQSPPKPAPSLEAVERCVEQALRTLH